MFSDHMRIDERSIALHKAVADRIQADPRLLKIAIKNLKNYLRKYKSDNQNPPDCIIEWDAIFEKKSLDEILKFLVSDDEKAKQLRQSSPFAGILTPQERWQIYEAYRPGAYYSSRG
jgi:hypothetical protein